MSDTRDETCVTARTCLILMRIFLRVRLWPGGGREGTHKAWPIDVSVVAFHREDEYAHYPARFYLAGYPDSYYHHWISLGLRHWTAHAPVRKNACPTAN